MRPNTLETVDVVTFTKEIFHGEFHFCEELLINFSARKLTKNKYFPQYQFIYKHHWIVKF